MMKEFFQGVSEAFGMSQPYDPPKFPKEQQLNPPPEIVELARMKIKLKTDTTERMADHEFVENTANAVRAWPSWMRGDYSELDP